MVRIWTDDGADGTGYSYTIGTGGSAVVALLRDDMAPWLLGRDAGMVEEIWKGLFLYTHANSVGATVSLALAAVDIALWDLRCKRAHASLHLAAGGAQHRVPIYNTEGGWLNFTTEELVRIIANAIDEAATIDRLAGGVGKINAPAILHVHSLCPTPSNRQQNQRECQPFHCDLLSPRGSPAT